MPFQHTVLERFLRYVQIDTQADPNSKTFPSTEKQKDLGRLLAQELQDMGLTDAHLDEHGYVYATIPSTVHHAVPVICFCSHMDTSPDASGTGVKPLVHHHYNGQDIVLPEDTSVVIRMSDHPNLAHKIGQDIVTASGTTLLGADNKAGVAAIMDAALQLIKHPEIPHGTIKILFTPDEEVGRGVDKVDLKKLGADYAYTIDSEDRGCMEDETFSADAATVEIEGISAHPGLAKGKMENAIKIATDILAALPKDHLTPETTSGREGFIHPGALHAGVETAKIQFIIRDFNREGLASHAQVLKDTVDGVLKNYPHSKARVVISEQYRNMKEVLNNCPQVADYAEKAMRRIGIEPKRSAVRGGTDGSRLSFMGLPCPNVFAGEHAFHSRMEWVSVQDMEKSAETIVEIAKIWAEESR
jgi:tripeptide aminopeptidase